MNPIRRIADVIFVLVALGTVLAYPQLALQVVPMALAAWWLTLLADAVGGKLGDILLLLGTFLLMLALAFLASVLLSGTSGDAVTMPLLFGAVGTI